jgi:MOSC domain-containing protein YiiM
VQQGYIVGVSVSEEKGTSKRNIEKGYLRQDYGLVGDGHAGSERQVSVLSMETIEKAVSDKGISARPGDFAENITLKGIDLKGVQPGQRLQLGEAEVEVTQVGKVINETHTFSFHGMVLLVTEGCFCRVIRSGSVQVGDIAKLYPVT